MGTLATPFLIGQSSSLETLRGSSSSTRASSSRTRMRIVPVMRPWKKAWACTNHISVLRCSIRSRPMYGELSVKACVAAGDGDRYKATCLKISVDGRRRMSPPVPDDFVGNVVLWAYPRAGINV
ncbi:hypothetical protein Scep_019433 [Stephania cephalantha]|uniref:Uncharacterized protein n=1 Tax=Stephania cephalantha TaxID=152367 RepID=A0AAP0IAR7_9MAGN